MWMPFIVPYVYLAMLVTVSQLGLCDWASPFTTCIVFSGTTASEKCIFYYNWHLVLETMTKALYILESHLLFNYVFRHKGTINLFILSLLFLTLFFGKQLVRVWLHTSRWTLTLYSSFCSWTWHSSSSLVSGELGL